jgi:nucleotide-binding universal stress UspA family protein
MNIENIVLTTDFSTCARLAYRTAVEVAGRFGARIHLVHALEDRFIYLPTAFPGIDIATSNYKASAGGRLDEEARREEFRGAALEQHLLDPPGPEAVARFAESLSSSLILQASHGLRGFERLLLGSFAERVLRSSAAPVLTVKARPGGEDREFRPRRILFPYDHSPCAAEALTPVRFLAQSYGAEVVVLHVFTDLSDLLTRDEDLLSSAVREELLSANEHLADHLAERLGDYAKRELAGIDYRARVAHGDAAEGILAAAREHSADLICMATHGRKGVARLFLGSVTEKVLRRAAVPVLTVRPPPAP